MRRILKRQMPSPAMVVAILALTVSLAGSAMAATISVLSKSETKQVKKLARKQANIRITKRAPKLSVLKAQTADSAGTANTATSAKTAEVATVGAPVAYAEIEGNGTVDTGSPSKGITDANVTNPSGGVYCFDLPFAPKTAAANGNPDGVTLEDDAILIYSLNPAEFLTCPETAEAEVAYIDASTAPALQSDDFNIQFDG